jgi:hypothetical protein
MVANANPATRPADLLQGTPLTALLSALLTLTGRRLTLTLRTPRAILLPLATPVLIAVASPQPWPKRPAALAGSTT